VGYFDKARASSEGSSLVFV